MNKTALFVAVIASFWLAAVPCSASTARQNRERAGRPTRISHLDALDENLASDFEIVAHRGASAYAVENTLEAFEKAVKLGARSVEFDVQRTQDGHLVILHDETLKDVTNGRVSNSVGELSLDRLKGIRLGRFDFEGNTARVPTLEETLDVLAKAPRPIAIHVEIKDGKDGKPYEGIERQLLDALEARPALKGRVVISSFNHDALRRVRAQAPHMPLGYLIDQESKLRSLWDAWRLGAESVNIGVERASEPFIRLAHVLGMKVMVYTVDTARDLARMRRKGADGVYSNFPDVASFSRWRELWRGVQSRLFKE